MILYLLILVLIFWLFFEYIELLKSRLPKIIKDFKELKEMEHSFAEEIKRTLIDNWEEEFEDEFTIRCDESGHEEITLEKRFLIDLIRKSLSIGEMEFHSKIKIKARKGAILIEKIKP